MAHKSPETRKSDTKEGTKPKLVRDSFTMPKADYALIEALKVRALEARRLAKKSELLRAGLQALAVLSPELLVKSLDALTPLKAGRPKKAEPAPAKTPARVADKVADKLPAPVQAAPGAKSKVKAVKAVKAARKSPARKPSTGVTARKSPPSRPAGKTAVRAGRPGAATR